MSDPSNAEETDTLILLKLMVKEAVKEVLRDVVQEVLDANQKVTRDSLLAKIFFYHFNIT